MTLNHPPKWQRSGSGVQRGFSAIALGAALTIIMLAAAPVPTRPVGFPEKA
jgi:hypothetical protein